MSKGAAFLRSRLQQDASKPILETIPARINKQPLHPLAALRQGRSQKRYFSTAVRRILSGAPKATTTARALPTTSVRGALSRTTLAPFSSPLRPKLTGGALPRASGGYSLGGAVRHFSHTPAAQAQVLQNVSAAMRAFCVNGWKAHYEGVDPKTGNKRFRAVTTTQEKALASFRNAKPNSKGTTLEFSIAPTITSIPSFDALESTIDSSAVLSGLASDFSRSLSSLALVHSDLKRLSTLGSLPIFHPNPHTLHVRFPGCDAKTVNNLCDELGIQRGIVKEDPEWHEQEGDKDVEMALLFPWAPSRAASEIPVENAAEAYFLRPDPGARTRTLGPAESLEWASMLSPFPRSSAAAPHKSQEGEIFSVLAPSRAAELNNPWLDSSASNSHSSFEALHESDLASDDDYDFEGLDLTRVETVRPQRAPQSFADYNGTEGILRFLEVCDGARR